MPLNLKLYQYHIEQMMREKNLKGVAMMNYLFAQYVNGWMSKEYIVEFRQSLFEAMNYFNSFGLPEEIDKDRQIMWNYARAARSFEECL